ncbi:hypothetical protein [Halorientalis salina]|uniref:hypothetical protein n=1 Tax=Halorientalis salina TaxID=2932266 RepID=UPI0010AD085B|nr:hypothetical protein [Halorientalis salina]
MARIRQALSDRSQATDTDKSDQGDGTRSSRSALLRKLLIVLGLGVVVYLVTRRGTITDRESNPTDSKSSVTTGSATAEQAGEELPGTDRVPGEIEQRGTEDAPEEPAEPGEMHVDEEIVDEVVEDEPDEGDDDAA